MMPLSVGSLATVAGVLVLGELVGCAVRTGRVNIARELLALLLSRIVRHPLGLQLGLPHVVEAVSAFHARSRHSRLDVEHLLAIEEDVLPALLMVVMTALNITYDAQWLQTSLCSICVCLRHL